MRLNKGNILIETLIALLLVMIMIQTIFALNKLHLVKKDIVAEYEKRI